MRRPTWWHCPCCGRCRGHDARSEQRLAAGGRNARAPARRPGGHVGLERGLDGGDKLRGLRVDDDVRRRSTQRTTCPACRGAPWVRQLSKPSVRQTWLTAVPRSSLCRPATRNPSSTSSTESAIGICRSANRSSRNAIGPGFRKCALTRRYERESRSAGAPCMPRRAGSSARLPTTGSACRIEGVKRAPTCALAGMFTRGLEADQFSRS
jgi:hypothetical protein